MGIMAAMWAVFVMEKCPLHAEDSNFSEFLFTRMLANYLSCDRGVCCLMQCMVISQLNRYTINQKMPLDLVLLNHAMCICIIYN